MNKIIPFNKELEFKENIGEIISIALDDDLKFTDSYTIGGSLCVRGMHKYLDKEEEFSYTLPVLISVDDKYLTDKATIGVDDFYYEIINDNVLRVKIDLILDNLYYKEAKEEVEIINVSDNRNDNLEISSDKGKTLDIDFDLEKNKDDLLINADISGAIKDEEKTIVNDSNITDLFKETNDSKEYSVYRVYTVEEMDTLDGILNKYKVTREDLEPYNDLQNIQVGMKLIIPSTDE